GEARATLADLKPGDELLVDCRDDQAQQPRHGCDIWAGADAQARATAAQRARHKAFLVARGLPGWIERVDGKKLTISLFSRDHATLQALLADAGMVPATWLKDKRWIAVVVADHELRTYNPPVDKQHGPILELLPPPADGYGCGGERWVFEPRVLLEGFRPGRLVRVFAHDAWKVEDMPYGEGLYEHGFETNDDDPGLFPYRTDLYNPELPWFAAKPTSFPPDQSAHRVGGELIAIDAARRAGRFRSDRDGAQIDFTMPPYGTVLRCGAEGELTDLPLGTHCWFDLHQDAAGAFTRAAVVLDDASRLVQDTVTYRVEEAAADGHLRVARQIPPIKDFQDQMITPPDLGRLELPVDAHTRVWKGGKEATVAALATGDVLLADHGAVSASSPGACTEIWAGADTIAATTEHQRLQHRALVKAQGMPGLITAIEGRLLTVVFIAGVRADFPSLLDGDPWGKPVFVAACDELLKPQGAFVRMGFANHLPESATAGAYGCSGIRWVVDSEHPESYHVGQVLRVLKEGWPLPVGQEAAH
nr:hypothetical protein [Planctomycetota bacterium]